MAGVISREEAVRRIEVYEKYGMRGAARHLGITHSVLSRSLAVIKKHYNLEPRVFYCGAGVRIGKDGSVTPARPRTETDESARAAARQGWAPDYDLTHPVPDGLELKGTSVRYDGEGRIQQFWNKTRLQGAEPEDVTHLPDPKKITKVSTLFDNSGRVTQQWISEKPEDAEREILWRIFAAEMASAIPPADRVAIPERLSSSCCAIYPIGDHHLGMYSWAPETGANYDLEIGESLLSSAMTALVERIEPCDQAVIIVIGDFLHYDSTRAETPENRNLLDADGRAQLMIRVAVRALRHAVRAALTRHGRVRLILEPGNHDPHSMAILTACFNMLYEAEPRVDVDMSPAHFHYFEFGSCLIGTHHGHSVKMEKLPGIMAADRPAAWGRTTFRHFFTGHIHHKQHHDFPGCSVESLRILPPADAYAANHGYRTRRAMSAVVLHEEHGEVERHTVNPMMFEIKK